MKRLVILIAFASVVFTSCSKQDIDDEKPEIDLTVSGSFPQNCDTIWLGETFTFKALFKDNMELGSFSIEIHENFDHHAHSTEVSECDLSPVKDPVNPFAFIQDYEIAGGLKEYDAGVPVAIPQGNGTGLFDEGDYHFFIRLTDKAGWSAQKGLSIKMLHR
jgi:hypothetical protein